MPYGKKPVILKRNNINSGTGLSESSINDVLDTACDRLWEKHVECSVRRIGEMDEELARLEKELDNFLKTKKTNSRVHRS